MPTSTDTPILSDEQFDELAALLTGPLHRPGSDGYDLGAASWNVAVQSHPIAVVEAHSAEDVAATVRYAADHGIEVAVRATGHGAADPLDGVLLIRTGAMDELNVDEAGWARVGAGVTWGALFERATPLGLAPLSGSATTVGVVGYLTGGGLGPVARTFGVSADYVRAFDVVTGDGQRRRVSGTENFDLFWALRGGKGALGIVTAVELDLPRLSEIYGGALYFGAEDIAAVLHAWAEWAPDLPDAATTSVAIMRMPDAPFVPPPLAGKVTLAVRFAWVGDAEEAQRILAPLLAVATPVLGGIGDLPYSQIASIHADPVDPMPAADNGGLLREFPPDAVDALLRAAGPGADSVQVAVELRLLGGAIARTPTGPSAMGHRDAAVSLITIGIAAGPVAAVTAADSARIMAAMQPWSTGGSMPNFSSSADPVDVRRSYPQETLDRLVALSAIYDPRSVLRAARPVRAAAEMTR
ncbi:FAD-binding oxidoreductase [Amnibacterium flavum]|uniref:FAD-linked oxidase n=1 Tax=Amnibacterium flavum TaxID=2173173 RepID=A0A2V1HPP9_9MICO|nr:FAD-binding oxidoreductase [Amnibacterium flavum]PVZ94505.1 FAD-linked oxidase [Amnibacterium flavum]